MEASNLPGHTRGPWRLDGNTDGNFYGISAEREGFRGAPVVVWRGIARPRSIEGRANARLIAAAPELLEALSDAEVALTALINRYGYEDDNVTPKDWNEWVFAREARDAARAAIAKATTQTKDEA